MKTATTLFLVLFSIFSFSEIGLAEWEAPTPASQPHPYLKISMSQCRLWLYEKDGEKLKLVQEYDVGTVKCGIKRYPLGLGYITKIDFAPVWYPPAYTRWYFAAKKGIHLPTVVPFGHKLNYMGAFRISLSHNVPGKGQIYRIHGVRSGEENLVGQRVSGGCIRMRNEEGLQLVHKVSVGTPVEIVP